MKKHLLSISLVIFATSCILTRLARLSQCDFNYDKVVELNVNGINMLGKDGVSDFNATQSFGLSKAIAQRSLKEEMVTNQNHQFKC